MALPVKNKRYTAAEYLELERQAEYKSEFVDGKVIPFAGASQDHCLISASSIAELGQQLKETPNYIFASQMRLEVAQCYVYPDLLVVCGETRFADYRRDILLNPTLVIEILSPVTEGFDRGEKFRRYRTLSSLQTYVLISQHEPLVEVFERQEDGRWMFNEFSALDSSIPLPSIGCELQLAEIYDKVDFEQAEQEVDEKGS